MLVALQLKQSQTYCTSPRLIHRRRSLGIVGAVKRPSSLGIAFRRDSMGVLSVQVFADADYASTAADRRSASDVLVMY